MARLIDANAISKEICSLTMTITGLRSGKNVLNEFMKEYRRNVLQIVDAAPTVDAVEVTRCRDCKYYCQDKINGEICRHPELDFDIECYDHWINTKPDDFCSYGARNERSCMRC